MNRDEALTALLTSRSDARGVLLFSRKTVLPAVQMQKTSCQLQGPDEVHRANFYPRESLQITQHKRKKA
jgi:hypothetical protein